MNFNYLQIESLTEVQKIAVKLTADQTPFFISSYPKETIQKHLQTVKAGVFDFDHTIHDGNQWAEFRQRFFTDEQIKAANQIWDNYIDLYSNKSSDSVDQKKFEHDFTKQTVVQMKANHITKTDLEKIGAELKKRKGTARLFEKFKKKAIVSWGIADLIEGFKKTHGLEADVLACRLLFYKNGKITGLDESSVVTTTSKDDALRKWMIENQLKEKDILVVGDDPIVDSLMFFRDSLNILIKPTNNQPYIETMSEETWKHTDGFASDLEVILALFDDATT